MSEIVTGQGKVEYVPSWLERKLEEFLAPDGQVVLTGARTDMRDWPEKFYLCKYSVGEDLPFNAIIYRKILSSGYSENFMDATGTNQASTTPKAQPSLITLRRAMSNPMYLQKEELKFVLSDGVVVLEHEHYNRIRCKDDLFRVSWEGDLTVCPPLVKDEDKMTYPEGAIRGREKCIYALDAIIRQGGLF